MVKPKDAVTCPTCLGECVVEDGKGDWVDCTACSGRGWVVKR